MNQEAPLLVAGRKSLKASGKFFCGICKNELHYWHERETVGKTIYRFRCRKCKIHFNTDSDYNVLPIKRTKEVSRRIEQLKAEQERTKPKPDAPSAPVQMAG